MVEGDKMFSQTLPTVELDAGLVQNLHSLVQYIISLAVLRKIMMHLNGSRNSSLLPCIVMFCSLGISFPFWGYSSDALFFHLHDHAIQMHTAPA